MIVDLSMQVMTWKRVYIALVTLSLLHFYTGAQTTLIDYGSGWKYSDLTNAPPDQGGSSWMGMTYNDNAWESGPAQLGYGDNDENTLLQQGIITGYFRKEIQVNDPSHFGQLDMTLLYDDGGVVYINGAEVWRVNMPESGPIEYGTFAASNSGDDAISSQVISNNLVVGFNIIAIEIHQRSSGSSDLSFDFRLQGLPAGSVRVTRGPYLQNGVPDSVTIRWRTSNQTGSRIYYGMNPNDLNMSSEDASPKTEHQLRIGGLSPDTKYYYMVADLDNILIPSSQDLYFKTPPQPGTEAPITAWILGDCGTGNDHARDVRDAFYNYVGAAHTDLILFLGDNAYSDGTDSEYQFALFENMYENKLKNTLSYSCLGNHDGHSASSSTQSGPYYDIFTFPTQGEAGGVSSGTEAYYSFDYGNIHFISLDSYDSDRSVGGTMYTWCESDLQNTTADWIVAFWHHPPYSKGSHDSDSEGSLIQMRSNFLPLLEMYGVDLVLSGHSHSYERSYFINGHYGSSSTFNVSTHTIGATGSGNGRSDGDGVYHKDAGQMEGSVYITSGSSGKKSSGPLNHPAMYYSVAEFGSCVLEVNGQQMDVRFIRETGSVDDYFTLIKSSSPCIEGSPCDDGDDCTINDVYDPSCNCMGTFRDSDNDGVCDAEDQCPGVDDALIGMSCDDGDDCTAGDSYDQNCNCAGTFADEDDDGVCDAEDVCPGYDDRIDTDGDGIPDGCEHCISQTDAFIDNPLTHSGTDSASTAVVFAGLQQQVEFSLSGLNARKNKRKSKRFIDRVTVRYIDPVDVEHTYGIFRGDEVSDVEVMISGPVKSISVSLTDAYDGNSGVQMEISMSDVMSCSLESSDALPTRSAIGEENFRKVEDSHVILSPNPVSYLLSIRIDDVLSNAKKMLLEIIDIKGVEVLSTSLERENGTHALDLDVSRLIPGTYSMRLRILDQTVYKRFVVVR